MAKVHPTRIPGRWREGFALALHVIKSEFIGHDEFGHAQFDTVRSEVGELLYRLKYRSDLSVVAELARTAASFVQSWKPPIDAIVPVTPSRARRVQPVVILGQEIAKILGVEFGLDWIKRLKSIPELKNVYAFDERLRLLTGTHEANSAKVAGRKVLLFDDLFRSGATMNAITSTLLEQGGAAEVYALAITRTWSR